MLEKVLQQTDVDRAFARRELFSQEPQEIMIRYQIKKLANRRFLVEPLADGNILSARFRSAFILEGELAILSGNTNHNNGVVVLPVAILGEVVS